MRIGLLPLGRPTFDVEYATEKLSAMLRRLDGAGYQLVGTRELLLDAAQTEAAISGLKETGIDILLILQITFTDAAATMKAASDLDVPISIWAVPEPRLGGRLRLNAFCGLNLASHALGLNDLGFSWIYDDPETVSDADLNALLDGFRIFPTVAGEASMAAPDRGRAILERIRGTKIGRLGAHPDGFHTCAYNPEKLSALAGVTVDELGLETLFDAARNAPANSIPPLLEQTSWQLHGLDQVNQDELERSLRLKIALEQIKKDGDYSAFAIRCWPETFTEYGGAVCGPVSMMGEARIPCACEADVYGALTQLVLQEAANAPVFLTDLVDVDIADDSAVVWHCGQAPVSMCADHSAPEATIHTNRKMPLLYQFTLKPGRVTLFRVSQARGSHKLAIATGEMLERPMAFTGTSGTLRFDSGAKPALETILCSGLEHHMALAYGDHLKALTSLAAALDIPVVEI